MHTRILERFLTAIPSLTLTLTLAVEDLGAVKAGNGGLWEWRPGTFSSTVRNQSRTQSLTRVKCDVARTRRPTGVIMS